MSARKAKLKLRLRLLPEFSLPFHSLAHREQFPMRLRRRQHGLGQGEGRKGFGLLGAGAAQASLGTAIGFGYFGAAKKLCDAFLTKGSNVELPEHTPIFLRLDSNDPSLQSQRDSSAVCSCLPRARRIEECEAVPETMPSECHLVGSGLAWLDPFARSDPRWQSCLVH